MLCCIEITNVCNHGCTFCPYPDMERKKEYMPLNMIIPLLEQQKQFDEYIYLHVMGEPTLHPDLNTVLGYCAGRGIGVVMTSNGSLKHYPKVVPLVRKGYLTYSLQTPQSKYGLRMSQINWEEHMLILKEALRVYFLTHPERTVRFEIHMLDTRFQGGVQVLDNDEDIHRSYATFSKIVEELEQELGLMPFPRPGASTSLQSHSPLQVGVTMYLKGYTPFGGTVSQEYDAGDRISCDAPQNQSVVLVNGDVIPCCQMSEVKEKFVLGNTKEQSLVQIRQGAKFKQILDHCNGTLPALKACRQCNFARPI